MEKRKVESDFSTDATREKDFMATSRLIQLAKIDSIMEQCELENKDK